MHGTPCLDTCQPCPYWHWPWWESTCVVGGKRRKTKRTCKSLCPTPTWLLIDFCAIIKSSYSPPPGETHLSHEISRQKVKKEKAPVSRRPRHADAQQRSSTKRAAGRTDSCSWCGLHVKSASKNLSARGRRGERASCTVLCGRRVGQLLLLAQFAHTAWWCHSTLTPCPHVPISLSLTNIAK